MQQEKKDAPIAAEGQSRFTIDGAILALVLTATAYAVAYSYEVGYTQHFGVPSVLIEVQLGSFARALLLLTLLTLAALMLQALIIWFVETKFALNIPTMFKFALAGALLFAGAAALLQGGLLPWLIAATFASTTLLGMFVLRLLVRPGKTYNDVLLRFDTYYRSGPLRLPQWVWALLVVSYGVIGLTNGAENAGRSDARRQTTFLIADSSPACVIIRTYGDTLVCAQYKGSKPIAKFRLISTLDSTVELTLAQIGPLRAVPEKLELIPDVPREPSRDQNETATVLSQ